MVGVIRREKAHDAWSLTIGGRISRKRSISRTVSVVVVNSARDAASEDSDEDSLGTVGATSEPICGPPAQVMPVVRNSMLPDNDTGELSAELISQGAPGQMTPQRSGCGGYNLRPNPTANLRMQGRGLDSKGMASQRAHPGTGRGVRNQPSARQAGKRFARCWMRTGSRV